MGIVEDFVEALLAREWKRVATLLTPDVRRDGFEGAEKDGVAGREAYLTWLSALVDPLYEYSWDVHRIEYSASGTSAFVEADSRYRALEGDEPYGYRMIMVVDLTPDPLISKVSLYWKTPEKLLPGGTVGASASAAS